MKTIIRPQVGETVLINRTTKQKKTPLDAAVLVSDRPSVEKITATYTDGSRVKVESGDVWLVRRNNDTRAKWIVAEAAGG